MKRIRLLIVAILMFLVINTYPLAFHQANRILYHIGAILLFVGMNALPSFQKQPSLRLRVLADGTRLLGVFLLSTLFSMGYVIALAIQNWGHDKKMVIASIIFAVVGEAVVFWNGIIRIYLTSQQLGVKWRVIGAICGWMPLVHLFVLGKLIRITSKEVDVEVAKIQLNQERKPEQICKTKYPLLMVHGVFFRDFRFFDYWGRISGELKENGATIYYGNQQSAASVSECGKELAERIQEIVKETGCEKVNIIAHSKGGLDSRSAISEWGAAPYVASLTTINTPHRGCLFADYLLDKIPDGVCANVADKYNRALKHFGDTDPNFMLAVNDLTSEAAKKRNEVLLDSEDVYYQSVGSKMNVAMSGRFPLNMSYPLVKHFDGSNDGLVSVESSKWGEKFYDLQVKGGRGISHGDIIDLNRENVEEFDVREFYVKLVEELKGKGL